MVDRAEVLVMFQSYRTADRRLGELISAVVEPNSMPPELKVTAMPGRSIYDTYFGRRISATEAGIEVVGIDSFLETMSGHQKEDVGLFRIANEKGWLLGAFDQDERLLLACVGKFAATE